MHSLKVCLKKALDLPDFTFPPWDAGKVGHSLKPEVGPWDLGRALPSLGLRRGPPAATPDFLPVSFDLLPGLPAGPRFSLAGR